MGNAFLYGGSSNINKGVTDGLNIKIYASEDDIPETADENTVAIVTSVPMPYYTITRSISDYKSKDSDVVVQLDTIGRIYIIIGHHSPAYLEINNGNNSVRIYPIAVYQCIHDGQSLDNIYVERYAKVYRDGEWHELKETLYSYGDRCESITGGWEQVTDADGYGKVSFGSEYLFLGCHNTATSYASIYTVNKINVNELTRLHVVFSELTHVGDLGIKIGICDSPYTGTSFSSLDSNFIKYVECKDVVSKNNDVDIDILNIINQTTINGQHEYHVQIAVSKSNATITDIYFDVGYGFDEGKAIVS